MTEWQEKMRSIGMLTGRKSIKKPVVNEDTGGVAGYHTEYRDGHQDATVVLAEPVRLRAKVETPEAR